jgi:hypothetical protein
MGGVRRSYRRRLRLIATVSTVVLAGATAPRVATVARSQPGSCVAGRLGQSVPIEIASGKPFVPVSINGSATKRFILDTGSFNAALDNRLVRSLGFSVGSVLSTSAGAGAVGGSIDRLNPTACEQMAGASLSDGPILGMDLRFCFALRHSN